MKRARTRIRTAAAPVAIGGRTTPQRDEATGTDRGGASYSGLRLPHERDEDPGSMRGERQPLIAQAARDLAEGQTDTDCYGQARISFRRRYARRRK